MSSGGVWMLGWTRIRRVFISANSPGSHAEKRGT
jgi:hypothetical protein